MEQPGYEPSKKVKSIALKSKCKMMKALKVEKYEDETQEYYEDSEASS